MSINDGSAVLRTGLDTLARKYSDAEGLIHPSEIVDDLITVLEANESNGVAEEGEQRQYAAEEPKEPEFDEALWAECLRVCPANNPADHGLTLPYECGTIDGGIHVWLVDGNRVKIDYDPDYVEGGNGEEDDGLCPKDCIVIDACVNPSQWPAILLHEAVERRVMANEGWTYDRAHTLANKLEMTARRRAKILDSP